MGRMFSFRNPLFHGGLYGNPATENKLARETGLLDVNGVQPWQRINNRARDLDNTVLPGVPGHGDTREYCWLTCSLAPRIL